MKSKPHYTTHLKAFVNGSSGGFQRLELYRLELIVPCGPGPKWKLTTRGKERAQQLGYLPKETV